MADFGARFIRTLITVPSVDSQVDRRHEREIGSVHRIAAEELNEACLICRSHPESSCDLRSTLATTPMSQLLLRSIHSYQRVKHGPYKQKTSGINKS